MSTAKRGVAPVGLRPVPTLKQLFGGPLATAMRRLAFWRKRGMLGRRFAVQRSAMRFEALEPRLLLSADLVHSTASGVALDATLRVAQMGDTQEVQLVDNGTGTVLESAALDHGLSVEIQGADQDDALTIDFDPSTLEYSLSVQFDGAAGSDTLIGPSQNTIWNVTGSGAGALTDQAGQALAQFSGIENLVGAQDTEDSFVFDVGGSLSGTLDGGADGFDELLMRSATETVLALPDATGSVAFDGRTLSYANLEPFLNASDPADVVINATALDDALVLEALDAATMQVRSLGYQFLDAGTLLDALSFAAPATSLTLNLRSGDDALSLGELDPGFSASVAVLGGEGSDTLGGPDAANAWQIDAPDSGKLNATTSFLGFENLAGGTQADSFALTADGSLSGTLDGGAGTDTLIGPSQNTIWNVTGSGAGALTDQAGQALAQFSGVENLVGAQDTEDSFVFEAGGSLSGTLDGGVGGFDELLMRSATETVLTLPDATGSATFDGRTLSYANLEPFLNASDPADVVINATALDDALVLEALDAATMQVRSLGYQFLDAGTLLDALSFVAPASSLTLNLRSGDDALSLGELDPGFSASVTVLGGEGSDTLGGPDAANVWEIDAPDSGTLNAATSFLGFENLAGGAQADSFALTVDGSLSGTLDGGAGTDMLVGPARDSAWFITGADAGFVRDQETGDVVAQFAAVENLTGSDGADDGFVVAVGGSLSGTLDGGAGGVDTLVVQGEFVDAMVVPDAGGSGTASVNGTTVTYAGLDDFVGSSGAATVVTGTVLGDNLVLEADADDAANLSLRSANANLLFWLSNGFSDSLSFAVPTGSLTINGGFGDDTLTVAVDLDLPGSDLTINAEHIVVNSGVTISTLAAGAPAGDIALHASDTPLGLLFLAFDFLSASASVTVDGATLRGGNVVIDANADADRSWDQGSGGLVADVVDFINAQSLFGGVAIANAEARVSLGGMTDIEATSLTLHAEAHSNAVVESTGIGLAFALAKSNPTAEVTVGSGVHLATAGDLTVSTDAESTAEAVAKDIGVVGQRALSRGQRELTLAIGVARIESTAWVQSGATLDVGGNLTIDASVTKEQKVEADAAAYADGSLGTAFALSGASSSVKVLLDGDADVAGNLEVKADTSVTGNETLATAQVGNGIGAKVKLALGGGAVGDKLGQFAQKVIPPPDQRSQGATKFAASAAFAYADHSNIAVARIGDGAQAGAHSGYIHVAATITDAPKISARAFVDSQKLGKYSPAGNTKENSVSVAIAVGNYANDADAHVGAGATVDAGGELAIESQTLIPLVVDWGALQVWNDLKAGDWAAAASDLSSIGNTNFGIQNGIFTSWAQSNAEGTKTAVSLSGDWLHIDNGSHAYIGEGAQVNQDASYRSGDQHQLVSVRARNLVEAVNLSGVVGLNLGFFGPHGGDTGAGGSYLQVYYGGAATAQIYDGARVYGDGLIVLADSKTHNFSLALANGNAADFGIDGAFSLVRENNRTLARIDNGASVETSSATLTIERQFRDRYAAPGFELPFAFGPATVEDTIAALDTNHDGVVDENDADITSKSDTALQTNLNQLVAAEDDSTILNGGGGITLGKSVGVGFSVAINEIARDTEALVGKRSESFDTGAVDSSNGTIGFDRPHGYVTGDAIQYDPSGATPIVAPGTYYVIVVDPRTIRLAQSRDDALADTPIWLALDPSGASDETQTLRDPQSAPGSDRAAGNVRLAAVNDGSIGSITVAGAVITKAASKPDPEGQKAPAKGGKFGFGLSVDVAVNIVDDVTRAALDDALLTTTGTGDLAIAARDDSHIFALAGAVSVSTSGNGIGASGAWTWDAITQQTEALVTDSALDLDGDFSLAAANSGRIVGISAGLAGGGKVGVAGSVSVNDIEATARARLEDSAIIRASAVDITAENKTLIHAIAAAPTFGGKASIGASVAVNHIDATTEAVSRNSDIGSDGGVTLTARNGSEIAAASAAIGASKGPLAAAVAVSVNTITERTSALIEGKRSAGVNATGDIVLDAHGDSTIFSLAGSIGASTGSAGVGISTSVNTVNHTVEAAITGTALVVSTAGDVRLTAEQSPAEPTVGLAHDALSGLGLPVASTISSGAIGGGAANKFGVAGSVSVNVVTSRTLAHVGAAQADYVDGQQPTVSAWGDVQVAATDDTVVSSAAGNIGGGGTAGIGIASTTIVTNETVEAFVGVNAAVDAGAMGSEHAATPGVSITAKSSEEIRTAAVAGTFGGTFGGVGSATVTVLGEDTLAFVDQGARINQAAGAADAQNVEVMASDDTSTFDLAGALAGGGSAGVGLGADVLTLNKDTEAFVAASAAVSARGDVSVKADSSEDIVSLSASVGGGGSAGIGGTAGVPVIDITTKAFIGPDRDESVPTLSSGTVTFLDALVGSDSIVRTQGSWSDEGFAPGQSIAISGSSSNDGVYTIDSISVDGRTLTLAPSDELSFEVEPASALQVVEQGGSGATLDSSNTITFADNGADPDTIARSSGSWIADGFQAGQRIAVSGSGANDGVYRVAAISPDGSLLTLTPDAALSSEQALAGALGIALAPTVVEAEGNVVIAASDDTQIDVIAGNITGAGAVSVGASATVPVVHKKTQAFIGRDAIVDAHANGAAIEAKTGEFDVDYEDRAFSVSDVPAPLFFVDGTLAADLNFDGQDDLTEPSLTQQRVATARTDDIRGVAVTAVNQDDIETAAMSGGGSGTVAVNIGGSVNVVLNQTTAFIDSGAIVNADTPDADASQSVLVAAGNDYYHMGMALALSGSGAVSVTPGADVAVVADQTEAYIGAGAEVHALSDVAVRANALEHVLSVSAGIAGSGTVAVGGAVSVISLNNATHAYIGEGALVEAGGNVLVEANDLTEASMITGSAGVGIGAAGVGASVGVIVIHKETQAYIGDGAQVQADGQGAGLTGVLDGSVSGEGAATLDEFHGVAVQARSSENVFSLAATVAAGFYAGVGGAVTVEVIDSDTSAYIGELALVNADAAGAGDEQSVSVSAYNDARSFSAAGGFGAGAGGVGGAVDVGVLRNDTTAYIGQSAEVHARKDVDVNALSRKQVDSLVLSAAAGVVGGVGSVSVWAIGSAFDASYSDADQSESAFGATDPVAFADAMASGGDPGSGYTVMLEGFAQPLTFDPTAAVSAADGTIDLGTDAQLQTGDAVVYSAGGGEAIGGLTDGATYYVIATDDPSVVQLAASREDAYDGAAITLDPSLATGDQHSLASATADATGDAGAQTAEAAPSGAVGDATIDAETPPGTQAFVDAGATISAGDDVGIRAAEELRFDVVAGSAAAGAGGIGASIAVANLRSNTDAHIASGATVNAGGEAGDEILVSARLHETATGYAFAGQAGGAALGAQVVVINDTSAQSAYVEDGALLGNAGTVTVSAVAERDVQAYAIGGGIGGTAAGAAVAIANVRGATSAWIDGASVGTGSATPTVGSIEISAENISSARASSIGVSAGISNGVNGSVAIATVDPTVQAFLGADGQVAASGDIVIDARSEASTSADALAAATGITGGVGVSVAVATLTPDVSAHIGENAVAAAGNDLKVRSRSNYDKNGTRLGKGARASATSGSGSLGVGGAGAVAVVTITPSVDAFIALGASASADNDLVLLAQSQSLAPTVQIPDPLHAGQQISLAGAQASGAGFGTVGLGVSVASATIGGSVSSHLDGATATAGRDLVMSSESSASAGAVAQAVSGGLAGGAGNGATVTIDPEVTTSIDGGASATAGRHLSGTAISEDSATTEAKGISVGLGVSIGVSFAQTIIAPTITAEILGAAQAGEDLSLVARHNVDAGGATIDSGASATASASGGGILSGNGADARAESSASVNARVGDATRAPGIDAGGDLSIEALSHNDADAIGHGLTIGVIGVGVVLANASVAGTTDATIADASVVTAEGDFLLLSSADNGASAHTTASGGGLASGQGAVATTTLSGGGKAELGDDVQVTAGGDASVQAQATNIGLATSGGGSFGAAAIGASVAHTTVSGELTAEVGDGAILEAGSDAAVTALSDDSASATATATAGGALGGTGAGAAAETDRTIGAEVGTGADVGAGQDIDIRARAFAQAHATATGTVASGAVGIGASAAQASETARVTASIGEDAILEAGHDLNIEAVFNIDESGIGIEDALTADATGSAGSLLAGILLGADAIAFADIDVRTEVGDPVELAAGNDLTAVSASYLSVDLHSHGNAGGLFAAGGASGTQAGAILGNSATTQVAEAAQLRAGHDMLLASGAISDVGAHATGASGQDFGSAFTNLLTTGLTGFFTGENIPSVFANGGTATTLVLDNTASTRVDAGARLDAGATLAVTASAEAVVDATSRMSGASAFIADAVAVTNVTIDSDAIIELGDGAFLLADDVQVSAENTVDASATAHADVTADIAQGTVTAISRLNLGSSADPSEARVSLGSANITGRNSVLVEALNHQKSANLLSSAEAKAFGGLISTSSALADGTAEVRSRVDSENDMVLTTPALTVIADSNYVLNRNPSAQADTVVTHLVEEIQTISKTVKRTVCKVLPWPLNLLCSVITDVVTQTITTVISVADLSSEYSFLGGGGLDRQDAIALNGNIYNFGAGSRQLTVNADGSIDPSSNVGASVHDGSVFVDPIVSDGTADMHFFAQHGFVSGGAVLHVSKVIDQLDVVNHSNLNLVFDTLDMVANADTGDVTADPDIDYRGQSDFEYEIASDSTLVESRFSVLNEGIGDVIFGKSVSNVSAAFEIVNEGGSISSAAPEVFLEVGNGGSAGGGPSILLAAAGSIGTSADPFDLRLVRGELNPDGTANDTPVSLLATAGGNLYLGVRGIENTFAPFAPSDRVDGVELDLSAGGTVSVAVASSEVLDENLVSHAADGAYDFTTVSAGNGVMLSVAAGDARLGSINAGTGSADIAASGSILARDGNPSANVIADEITLEATTGNVGAFDDTLDLRASLAGDVRLTASAGLAAYITNASGGFQDDGSHPGVQAVDLVLTAAGDIGSESNAFGVELLGTMTALASGDVYIDTQGNLEGQLTGENLTLSAGGDIDMSIDSEGIVDASAVDSVALAETAGDLVLGLVTAGTQAQLSAAGGIRDDDDNEALDIVAGTAILFAGGGIGEDDPLETQLDALYATALAGDVWLDNTGALIVQDVTASGDVNVTTHSPLIVSGPVVGAAIVLTSGAPDDLTVESGATIVATESVTLVAGGDLIVEAGSTIDSSGPVSLQAPGDLVILGAVHASSMSIDGNDDDNVIAIAQLFADTVVNTYGGNDIVRVGSHASSSSNEGGNVNAIGAVLTLDGGEGDGVDVLSIDDSGDTDPNSGELSANWISGLGMTGHIDYVGFEQLEIGLGSGDDEFTIASTHVGHTALNANAGMDTVDVLTILGETTVHAGADADTVNVQTISKATTVNGGGGDDTINVGSLAPAANGTLGGIAALLSVSGDEGDDTLNVDDAGEIDANGTLTGTQVTGLGMSDGIAYVVETLNIGLGSGSDTFTIESTHSGTTVLEANTGMDTVNVLTTSGETTVNAGADADTIHVQSIGAATTVTGGSGDDTVNVGSLAPSSGGTVDNIGALLSVSGDEGTDTLSVDDSGDTSANSGALAADSISGLDMAGTIAYGGFEQLAIALGSEADEFTIESTHAGTTTVLDANAGNDTVNVETVDSATTVNGGDGNDTINVGSLAPGLGGTVNGIAAPLTVSGDEGDDILNVDDSGDLGANVGTLTGQSLTRLGMSDGIDYSVETLSIGLGAGADEFTIESTHGGTTVLDTNGGNDTVNVLTISGETTVNAGGGDDTINAGSLAPSVGGTVNGIAAALIVNGDEGDHDTLNVDDTGDAEANAGTLTGTQLTGLGMSDGIIYAVEVLNIGLGSAADVFNVQGTSAVTNLATNDGDDRIYVSSDANVASAEETIDFLTGHLQNINGTLNIDGGSGRQRLLFSDEADTEGRSAVITDMKPGNAELSATAEIWITGLAPAGISYGATGGNFFDGIVYWTGSAADTIAIDGTAETAGGRTMTLLNTGSGDDTVRVDLQSGQDGYFALNAMAGDDTVDASESSLPLVVFGGLGDDDITGGSGDDVLFGDLGVVRYGDAVVGYGGVGDVLSSAVVPATVVASRESTLGGMDSIAGNGGEDMVIGGAADDAIHGGDGRDVLFGDDAALDRSASLDDFANPRFRALSGTQIYSTDSLTSGQAMIDAAWQLDPTGSPAWGDFRISLLGSDAYGNDTLWGDDADDMLFGELGNDTLRGGEGDDYVEGGGGDDVIYGDAGQDDLIGGSSSLFGYIEEALPADGSDTIFGGSADRTDRNDPGDTSEDGQANDADMILGDNGNVFRLVGTGGTYGGAYLAFNYDDYGALKIVPRAAELLTGVGGGDTIHGESGDDFVYGQQGDDVLYGDGQDDDLIGGAGNDWISGGDGRDGVIGDDGRIFTSRNGTAEPLNAIDEASVQGWISTPGGFQQAYTNIDGRLKKAVDLAFDDLADHTTDDILYGGLGDDWVHGGSGDDAISGAEAPADLYASPTNPGNVLAYDAATGSFAAYAEFAPLEKIPGFLLNFDAVQSDGDDRLFGDEGNDWLVGGTGQDHLYGGWGDDLLNADDDLDTNGGANDIPDSNPSYEDLAYGGAGRDVLIANTQGDRLIDWVGQFNSYIVPFNQFGLGTVSRTLQPQLAEFLYALSASDGADFTRAADTGADPARNGEPFGELGVVRQQDFAWQDQTGGPLPVKAGNIPGGKREVLRSASFDGPQASTAGGFSAASGFAADSGVWNVQNGVLQVSAASLHGDAVSVYAVGDALPGYFEVQASVMAIKPTAGWNANSFIVFDYQGKTDFKFAGLDVSLNKLVMGHRDAAGWHVDEQAAVKGGVKADTYYNVLLAVNGVNATLLVNNSLVFSHTYQPRIVDGYAFGLNWGMLGVGSNNSRGAFDNIAVQILPPQVTLDELEDFSDGVAQRFTGDSAWSVGGGAYDVTGDASAAFSMVDLGVPGLAVSSYLELNAKLTSERAGFVFDRYGDESFKFVMVDATASELTIGHYTRKSGWVNDAVFATTIESGAQNVLNLVLKGTTVSATLNPRAGGGAQAVLGYVFNAATVDGGFGLLATGGSASFDDVRIKTDDAAFRDTSGAAMLASGTPAGIAATATVTQAELDAMASVAISAWTEALGDADARLAALSDVRFGLADLPGEELGYASGNTILIDQDGAGAGWYVDASPASSPDFRVRLDASLLRSGSTVSGMDLFSVVEHEVGHVLGFGHDDDDSFAVMHADLGLGTRYSLFAGPGTTTPQPDRVAAPSFDAYSGEVGTPNPMIDWQASAADGWSVGLSPYGPQPATSGSANFAAFAAGGTTKLSSDAGFDRLGRDLLGKKPVKS